jgi:predicted secreted protein
MAVARDAAGNINTSSTVTVTVANDSTAPTVSLSAPTAGTVSGTVSVSANATDDIGVVGVQFQLDGADLGSEDTTAPYAIDWNTTTASNSTHTLTAVARDAAGNLATSSPVTVTVDNTGTVDTTAPTVALTAPPAGSVSGIISVSANAADDVGVVGVQFQIDGAALGSEDTTAPYAFSWDTTAAINGAHTLTAVARDAAGNLATSGAVTVTVDNADIMLPTVTLSAPAAGTVSGTVSVSANAADDVGVVGVQFQINGVALGSEDTAAPYAIAWDSTTATNGTYTLTAVARDAAGNLATSAAVTVTVDNNGGSGAIGLFELALMLIAVFVSIARNKSDKAKSEDRIG